MSVRRARKSDLASHVALTVLASCLMLCSCRSHQAVVPAAAAGLPAQAWTGAPQESGMGTLGNSEVPALPYQVHGPWRPPGIAGPWPPNEYLCDGGDAIPGVAVAPDLAVHGLGVEDTVAHYDAVDGSTLVEASNRVCIYAPRFGAVRSVTNLVASEQIDQPIGVALPASLARHDDVQGPVSSLQREQARGDLAMQIPNAYQSRLGEGAISSALGLASFQDAFLPFEDLQIIRLGAYHASEKARLSEGVAAALTWSGDQSVQVLLDLQAAVATTSYEELATIYSVEDLRDSPKLRVIKVASTQSAQPGDTVDFTIRFDNVGDQPLANIVLVDNLTTRLEYVPDSAQASVNATFTSEPNDAQSHVLRWEISDPLQPGEGGIVRFRCVVR